MKRVTSVLRTAVRRRGIGYASHLFREHALPRAAYGALLGDARSNVAAHVIETLFAARDIGGLDAVLRQARSLHEPRSAAVQNTAEKVAGVRARTDDFAHEWLALERLHDSGLVPAVVRADEKQRRLVLERIDGLPVGSSPDPARSSAFEAALNTLHRAGVVGVRFALNHVRASDDGRIRFAALPGVRVLPGRGVRFQVERDRDRAAVNEAFGLDLLTEAGARRALREVRDRLPAGWFQDYAPIDFGAGVSVGRFAATDSGTGRWEVFNHDVVAPIVRGRRVLDLGSNNGSMPLMMLRAGAAEVLAVERSPLLADAARVNARVFEWRDIRTYDLHIHVGDMRDALTSQWGRFDVITAFCSLYYLPEPDMAEIIRHAAGMGATLILQSNEAVENIPASRAARLAELLQEHGYDDVRIHAFEGFDRSILVGTPAPAAAGAPA